jgi:hypothetical protein
MIGLTRSVRVFAYTVATDMRKGMDVVRTVGGDRDLPQIDNNAAKKALQRVVGGRKNHYGSRPKRGTEVAAIFYTLFKTAKLSQVGPRAYVTRAARRAITHPSAAALPFDLI